MKKQGLVVGRYKRVAGTKRIAADVFFNGKLMGDIEKQLKHSWHPRHGPTVKLDGWEFTPINGGKSILFHQFDGVKYRNRALQEQFNRSIETTGTWIKGTEDDDEDYEYIPSAAELS